MPDGNERLSLPEGTMFLSSLRFEYGVQQAYPEAAVVEIMLTDIRRGVS